MVIAILAAWIGLLWLLVAIGVFERWTLWMKLSPLVLYLLLTVGLLIPMTFSAPLGPVAVLAYSVQVAPNVSGIVTEVPIKAGTPLKKGDVLFKLDPASFEAKVKQIQAQLDLANLRLDEKQQLAMTGSGRRTDLEQAQSDHGELVAQLSAAKWDLEHTTVRAPSDGYVPNPALQPGTRVNAGAAVMPFIDGSREVVAMKVAQSEFRHIKLGQRAEIIFELYPGRTFSGEVAFIVPANPAGQVTPSGLALSAENRPRESFILELKLDQPINHLPPGSVGQATVYTDNLPVTHVVRRVMIRMNSWLNYLPFG